MGKPLEHEIFLQRLKQLYSGSKVWGTVRVTTKRLFEENFKHKLSKGKERDEDRQKQCQDPTKEFKVVIKAATPQKHFSTIVLPNEAGAFEIKLTQVMQQALFKDILAKQEIQKKKKGAKALKEPAKD